MSSKAVLLRF